MRDQTRDKQLALRLAIAQDPDWIMGLDGDEPLESSAARDSSPPFAAARPMSPILKIQKLFMWNGSLALPRRRHLRADLSRSASSVLPVGRGRAFAIFHQVP